MRRILLAAIVMAVGCKGNEALEPIATPPVEEPSVPLPLPLPVFTGLSATYTMTLVNGQPLPVKSPFGAGEWDYDSDAGTWQLTALTVILEPNGVFTENMTHRAASGAISSGTFIGTYTRLSSSSLRFSDGSPTYTGEISANRLVMTFSNGGTFTFEIANVPGTAWVWGLIVDEGGLCIPGATVRVTKGQRAGETLTQKTPCDAWAYDNGFMFEDLTAGVEMTLQATAPGFEVQEKTIVPTSGSQMAFIFTPSRKK